MFQRLFASGNFLQSLTFGFVFSSMISPFAGPAVFAAGVGHISPVTTYYVSKRGNNSDGRSWKTAWNELDQIDWEKVRKEKTIVRVVIDGGSTSMTYNSPLRVAFSNNKNIVPSAIDIMRSRDIGHSGQIIIDGKGLIKTAITISASNTSLRGLTWRGIKVRGFQGIGIRVNADNVNLSGVEVSGHQRFMVGPYAEIGMPGTPIHPACGVYISGHGNVNLTGMVVHDTMSNIRVVGPVAASIRKSWVYSSYYLPIDSEQNKVGGIVNGYRGTAVVVPMEDAEESTYIQLPSRASVTDCVIGPGLGRGVVSAFNSTLAASDCLLLNASAANLIRAEAPDSHYFQFGNLQTNRVTSFLTTVNSDGRVHDFVRATCGADDLRVTNSIVYGGHVRLADNVRLGANNTQFKTTGNTLALSKKQENPKFVANVGVYGPNVTLRKLVDTDFRLSPQSPALGSGSQLTSVRQLLLSPLP